MWDMIYGSHYRTRVQGPAGYRQGHYIKSSRLHTDVNKASHSIYSRIYRCILPDPSTAAVMTKVKKVVNFHLIFLIILKTKISI